MLAKKILPFVLVLIVGGLLGYSLKPSATSSSHIATTQASVGENTSERKVLYWYDPMYPDKRFDKPGKSPFMDMDLMPRYDGEDEGVGIRIDPAQVQNMGVKTQPAAVGKLVFTRDVPANVEFNEYQFARVQPRADGFVEKIYSLAVGDLVKKGAPIVDITVPSWTSDQSEYLLFKKQNTSPAIVRGVRERMRISGMPEAMLDALDRTGKVQTRLTVVAPIEGVVTSIDIYPGMNVGKNMTIASIQGVNPVWVTADLPERDLHLIKSENRVRISVSAYPDRAFYAESISILPKVDTLTRTVPLRLIIANDEGALKPGMTASLRLRTSGEEALLIPTQSIIDLGDEQRVIVRAKDGSFIPKKIQPMQSSREQTAVASGIEDGDEIVVSGMFLIDSEANLRGALDRMRSGEAK